MATYYFDGSDASFTDPGGVWTNGAEAFNNDTTTAATATVLGSTSSNYLMAEGTNAPGTGGTIEHVKARIFSSRDGGGTGYIVNAAVYTDGLAELLGTATKIGSNTAGDYGTYAILTAPSAGWSWPTIQALETKIYNTGSAVLTKSIFIVEVEVTTIDATYPGRIYKIQGFQ